MILSSLSQTQATYVLVLAESLAYAAAVFYGISSLHPQMGKIVHQVLLVGLVLLPDLKDPFLHKL